MGRWKHNPPNPLTAMLADFQLVRFSPTCRGDLTLQMRAAQPQPREESTARGQHPFFPWLAGRRCPTFPEYIKQTYASQCCCAAPTHPESSSSFPRCTVWHRVLQMSRSSRPRGDSRTDVSCSHGMNQRYRVELIIGLDAVITGAGDTDSAATVCSFRVTSAPESHL